MIGEVRGRGLLLGLEFVADRKTRQPFPRAAAVTERIVRHLRNNDVIVAAGVPLSNFGKDGDHIQISPPFIISDDEIDILADALDAALTAVADEELRVAE
jgi:4-aminobutyrate aminotransferase-like enzyme